MGLLIIDPGLRLWGSERALLTTLPAVVAAHERVVLMAPPGAELVEAVEGLGLTVCQKPIALLHQRGAAAKAAFVKDVAAACLKYRIGRIHLNQAGPAKLVNLVAQMLGIPLVIHVRLREDVSRCAALQGSSRAPLSLLFVSQGMRDLYPDDRGEEPHKTLLTVYDPYPIASGPVPAREGAETPFICVGRLAAMKGQDKLIPAIALARKNGIALPTRLLGADACNGAYERELRDLATRCGVADLVDFAGYATEVLPVMAQSRFLVLPSQYEPLGRVLFEAWDAGLMPIAPATSGGAAEVLSASGGGMVYPENSPEQICAAMTEAMVLPEAERLAAVERGRAWARLNLSVEAYREKLQGTLF